jgi:hypothetical protein
MLESACKELQVLDIHRDSSNRPVIEFQLRFSIRNTGRVACYNWDLSSTLRNCPASLLKRATDSADGNAGGISLDMTILPASAMHKNVYFGMTVERGISRADFIHTILNITCSHRAIGESFIGAERSTRLGDIATFEWLRHDIEMIIGRTHDEFRENVTFAVIVP